jgi:hypothetical protein
MISFLYGEELINSSHLRQSNSCMQF